MPPFSASANATKLVFTTYQTAAASATAKMTLSSAGLLTIADDFVIKDGGTIGVASANDAMTISSAGIVTFKDDILIKDGANDWCCICSLRLQSHPHTVTFVDDIIIKDANAIGSVTADLITIASDGKVTFLTTTHSNGILVADGALLVLLQTQMLFQSHLVVSLLFLPQQQIQMRLMVR